MDDSPRPVSVNTEKPILVDLGNQRHGPVLVHLYAGTKRRPQTEASKRPNPRRTQKETKTDG